ncbi:MAG TPA: DUF3089 domain-containing protein [Pseudomonadales bacterium]
MLKKVLIGLVVLIVLLLLSGYVFRDALFFALMANRIAPDHQFSEALAPPAPDYADADAWAALPSKTDPADDRPNGLPSEGLPVSVFFVHPTSYMKTDGWNQPLDDEEANWIVDERVLRHQASVFKACCEIYAPRYRQATFFSFMDRAGNGSAALDLAYRDVNSAFDAFLAAIGDRPFIIAGHSQGTAHAARLLRERVSGSELMARLVVAYLIGFSISADQTGGIPACDRAAAIGCVVGWNAVDGDSPGIFSAAGELICTNPLTWKTDGHHAGHDRNRGSVGYPSWGPSEGEDVRAMTVEPATADAECRNGRLTVSELRSPSFPSRMPGNSLHIYDYSLFYVNLRENASARSRAFLSRH